MKKNVLIIVSCIVGLVLVYAIVIQKDGKPMSTPGASVEQPIPPEIQQDPEFIKSLFNGVELRHGKTSDGLYTVGHVPVEEGQRILEVHFLKRDINGLLFPLPLKGFSFQRHGFYFVDNAAGVRFAVGDPSYLTRSRVIEQGIEYNINGIMLPDKSSTTTTIPLDTTFTVPKDMPADSVYRVKMVVLDEQLDKKLADD